MTTRAALADAVRPFAPGGRFLAAHIPALNALADALGLPTDKADAFSLALAEVLKHEGGYVDHPKDPGGATNRGVTLATLSAWLGRPATKAEVKALTVEAVTPIYRKNYWDVVRGDDLPPGVALMVFDLAVNSGPDRAARFLQEALGVGVDGRIGPLTLEKANSTPALDTINKLRDRRERFYRGLSTFSTFGTGWLRRLEAVTKLARGLS